MILGSGVAGAGLRLREGSPGDRSKTGASPKAAPAPATRSCEFWFIDSSGWLSMTTDFPIAWVREQFPGLAIVKTAGRSLF